MKDPTKEVSVSMSQSLVGGIETDLSARCRIVDAQQNKTNKQTSSGTKKQAMNQANKE